MLTEYAVKREARRSQRVWLLAPFVVAMVMFRFLAVNGRLLATVIYLPIAGALVWLLVSMLLPVHPDRLVTPVVHPVGSWSAQVRALSFRRVVEKRPRIGAFTELPGRVTFQPDGTIVWVMGVSNRMVFGPLEHRWESPYQVVACRVKGPWHQVHVAIQSGPHGAVDDLWLRRARDFPI